MYAWNVKNDRGVTLTSRRHRILWQKRRGGVNRDRNFRFFVLELRCPFIAGSNLCSQIPDVRATNSGEMYQRTFVESSHFYVIYEHNSRICVTFLSSASSDYNDLSTENIPYLNIKRVYLDCNDNSVNWRNPDFSRFAYGVIDAKMENARNIGTSATKIYNNIRFLIASSTL